MKVSFFVIALIFSLNAFAQADEQPQGTEQDEKLLIGERGLNRFFLDGSFAVVVSNQVSGKTNEIIGGATINFRIGNNFYFGKGLKPVILRLTYFRSGILFADPFGFYNVFPSVGLGKHFNNKVKKANSIEPMLHAGVIAAVADIINYDLEFYPYFSGEVKFNFRKFAFGIELSTKKFKHSASNYSQGYYVGFSFGLRFGKGLRFSN
ncbi:hypothetical protein [Fluviicola sp.]|uniref:hypothetical protein n=1 Tax=Fluviicola sp. TaxID=1917219 RepID=UPI0031DDE021